MISGKEPFLFVVSCELDINKTTGIQKKIFNQRRVLREQYSVFLVGYTPDGLVIIDDLDNAKTVVCENRRKDRANVCERLCREHGIKKCLIRNAVIDPFYMNLIKRLKVNGVSTAVEIPTYPYDLELCDNIKHRLLLSVDKFYRRSVRKYIDRIVTYSNDDTIYGIKCINIHNGINVEECAFDAHSGKHDDSQLRFIGVAKICDWHGYDRLISGIAKYKGPEKVYFHIVGDGPALAKCKEISDSLNLGESIIFHGFQSGDSLDEIYACADLGVDCLGLHRKGMEQVSSLKSREYASKGLPIVCANSSDVISDDWEFLIKLPAIDEAVDIDFVIRRFKEIRSNTDYRNTIRLYAEKNFDIKQTFSPVMEYFGGLNVR